MKTQKLIFFQKNPIFPEISHSAAKGTFSSNKIFFSRNQLCKREGTTEQLKVSKKNAKSQKKPKQSMIKY